MSPTLRFLIRNFPYRRLILILTIFLLTLWLVGHVYSVTDAAREDSFVGDQDPKDSFSEYISQVPIVANDVVYNPMDQMLYVSVPSSVGVGGNSIVPVNPSTLQAGTPVFVGSEPGELAMSDDGHTLYVFLEGAYSIRRFDTSTHTPGQQFMVGQDSFHGIYRAADVAVAPGNPNLVAVARYYLGTSPPEAGVAVFDNGVQRMTTTPGHTDGANSLAFSESETKLYGGGDQPLQTMTIDASGVTVTSSTSFTVGQFIKFAGGRIYSSSGQVVNPDSGTLLGTFSGASGTTAFVPDPTVGRAYYVTRDFSSGAITLKAYDINTFVQVGTAQLGGITGDPTALVRWGTNGLALRTSTGQLQIIRTSLIPSADPSPTPTPTPTATPTPTPTPALATFIRKVALPSNDMILNPQNQLLYVSVPSSAGATGNSIRTVDPANEALGAPIFVGSEPGRLALSSDSQTMYVGLNGAGSVRRVNLSSQTAGLQFSLGTGSFDGPFRPDDIAVMPANPNTVAVSRFFAGTAIYDDGVARAQESNAGGQVEFGSSTRLYIGASPVQKLDVSAAGLTTLSSFPNVAGGSTQFINNLLYSSSGGVINPETGEIKGRFGTGLFTSFHTFAIDVTLGKAFFLTGDGGTWTIRSFDLNTLVPTGSVSFQDFTLGSFPGPTSLVRWGTNGLAFRTANHIFLIQTALVSNAAPVPSPTPSPSPTPTPSPAYIPTLVRPIDLPANDLVIRPSTQTLYVSVPSVAGVNGNSITTINPQTGQVGTSTFVGSEPGKLALADEQNTLYVNLEGANLVRRFDIPTSTPGIQFAVGVDKPPDMDVLPGSPQSIAVSRGISSGVAIYDSGVQRPNSGTGGAYGIGPIEFGSSAAVLYGYNIYDSGADFVKFAVDASGVQGVNSARGFNLGAALKFANARLYGSSGRVIDPETRTLLGTFNAGGTALAVDTSLGRVFFLANDFGSGPTRLLAFDLNTFLPLGSVTLQGVTGTPRSLVRWGVNGLAFNTVKSFDQNSTSQVYLVQSELVSNAEPIPSTIQFNSASYFTFEGNSSPATVTVTRMGGVTGAASINYATSNGTATAGSDYTATSGTLNFADGEATKTFTISMLDDDVFEGNETINLTLSNPSGGPTLGTPATAVLTINDGEGLPFVQIGANSIVEGDSGTTPVTFTVTLSNRTNATVTMNFATADGTATSPGDYTPVSGTLTFNPLEKTKTVTVLVNGDLVEENHETFTLNLTNIMNASNFPSQATGNISDDDSPGFRFSALSYTVNETDPRATLIVTRKGDTSTSATVNYQTLDLSNPIRCDDTTTLPGRSFARCDYATSLDTLTFGPGVSQVSFTIPIINDTHVEGPEAFQVVLSAANGALLVTPNNVFVSIIDDDVAGAANPIFDSTFFVRQHYLDFLSREPEPSGLQAWVNVLNNCSDVNNNPSCDRLTVSAAFFGSEEFRLKGFYVFLFYKVALNRLPTYSEIVFHMRQVTGQTPDEVYARRALFSQNFVQRTDFNTVYQTMPNNQFVAALLSPYGVTSIHTVDPANPDTGTEVTLTEEDLVDALTESALTRAQVLRAIVQSREVTDREFNGAFVAMQYYGYLRRIPEFTGYQAWLNYLNAHPGDFRTMVNGFMNSQEYRLRFGTATP